MRKPAVILLSCAVALFGAAPAFAADADAEAMEWKGVIYDSVTLDDVRSIESVTIELDASGEHLSIGMDSGLGTIEIDAARTSDGVSADRYVSEESASFPGFNVLYWPGEALVATAYTELRSAPNFNEFDRLALSVSNEFDAEEAAEAIAGARAENAQDIAESLAALESPTAASAPVQPQSASSAHVYVSGTSIPFLVAGGWSEGYAYFSGSANPYVVTVNRIKYAVAYNWPSDGVSLWYDYIGSTSAYHTPAWPSGGTHNAYGTWSIDTRIGKLVAESTVSALLKGVPLMWTLYDTADL